jgi:hypothetical protein
MALEWSDQRIANALSITVPTLRKHYFRELKVREEARDRVDGMRVEMLWHSMREGNVAAMKEYSRLAEAVDRAGAQKRFEEGAEEDEVEERLGKKERANLEAQTAGLGTGWGDDLLGSKPN